VCQHYEEHDTFKVTNGHTMGGGGYYHGGKKRHSFGTTRCHLGKIQAARVGGDKKGLTGKGENERKGLGDVCWANL